MKNLKFGLGRIENIVAKGENAGYQHFLVFQQCFSEKASFPGLLTLGFCGKGFVSVYVSCLTFDFKSTFRIE